MRTSNLYYSLQATQPILIFTSQRRVAVVRSVVGITFIVVEAYHKIAPSAMTMSSLGLFILITLQRGTLKVHVY